MYFCANCDGKSCEKGEKERERMPSNCPCNDLEYIEEVKSEYEDAVNHMLSTCSSLVEKNGYRRLTRVEETIEFAKRCGFQTLGLAFCSGFSREAGILIKILMHHGFRVESVVCKNGSIPKEILKLKEEDKIHPGKFEAMCNPIGQARLLNRAKSEFNIVLGLCVGHDSLFIKYSEAPVTVLGVKDRVLAHNPMGALYLSEGYYKDKLYPRD